LGYVRPTWATRIASVPSKHEVPFDKVQSAVEVSVNANLIERRRKVQDVEMK
jgi:hypothetical protein